jgi:hypothetical protein
VPLPNHRQANSAPAHVQVSSSAAPPHAHHSDPFSNAGGSHRSQPHSGPYLPAPVSTLPDSRSQTRPPGPTMSSNSLAPPHPGGSAASAQHSSASNMWVNHEFPKTTLHSSNQSGTSSPQPGFFELRQSTFTSLVASQSAMEPTAPKPTSKKRKFVSGEDKNPKARKRSKPKDEKKESVRPHMLSGRPVADPESRSLMTASTCGFLSLHLLRSLAKLASSLGPSETTLTSSPPSTSIAAKKTSALTCLPPLNISRTNNTTSSLEVRRAA